MKRRLFLKAAAAGGTVLATGAVLWLNTGHSEAKLGIEGALAALDQIDPARAIATGAWSPAKTFAHVAQSIELSLVGFPEPQSALFQSTVGAAAFAVFAKKGRMWHGLDEPIPGAPALPDDGDTGAAIERLRSALIEFERHADALKPHFAYGQLSKDEYTRAHVMHLYNHLTEIRTRQA